MANVENIQNIETAEPQAQNHLKVIDAECTRMSRLVRDMLLLASSDADQWTVQIQEVNIDTILITLYEAYEPVCRKKAIHLDLVLGEDSYPQLHTDQERLFQILSIFWTMQFLIHRKTAALKYRPDGRQGNLLFLSQIMDAGLPKR